MNGSFSPRRIGYGAAALAVVLVLGMIGFHWSLHEPWLQSFYRSLVTSALVGLDTVPSNDSSRLISIFMVLAGVTIFAVVATTLVESIARGVLTGALAEKLIIGVSFNTGLRGGRGAISPYRKSAPTLATTWKSTPRAVSTADACAEAPPSAR